MKKNQLFLGLATMFATALAFTACSSEEPESLSNTQPQDNVIRFTSSVAQTRATEDPQGGTSLSTSAEIGIWAINGSEALTNGSNEEYTVDANGKLTPKTTDKTMTWPSGTTLNFYAYAPYSSSYNYNQANEFSVQADQSTTANYLKSDLVLAQTLNQSNSGNEVALQFKHLLSKINITITKASGASVDLKKAKVTITNTKLKATFNPSATDNILGTVDTENGAADITAVSELGESGTTACAIIVPQTIAKDTRLIKIETYPGESSNRILYAKLSDAVTFASGEQYKLTVEVGDLTAPETEVALTLGSATLVQWSDKNLGASTEEVYVAGDYVLADGTLVHKAALTDAQKTNVRAIVFTNGADDLSAEDKTAGYVGYAMSVVRMGSKKWMTTGEIAAGPTTLSAALAELNGLTKTATLQSTDGWSTDNGDSFVNFTNYTTNNPLPGSNLSSWFAPSFGQMIQILNNLGGANFAASSVENGDSNLSNNSAFYTSSDGNAVTAINTLVTGLGKTDELFKLDTSNNVVYTSVTENSDKFWYVKIVSEYKFELGRSAGKSGTGRSVLPIVAFKLPTSN